MGESAAPNGQYRLRRIEADIETATRHLEGHEVRLRSLENHDGILAAELHSLGDQVRDNNAEVRSLRRVLIGLMVTIAIAAVGIVFTVLSGVPAH